MDGAKGVAYVERESRRELEVYAKIIVVAASCITTAQIMLNSRSRHWPTGIANSSGQLGKNLCDHLYGTSGYGYMPQLLGQPSFSRQCDGRHRCVAPSMAEPAESTRREVYPGLLLLSRWWLRYPFPASMMILKDMARATDLRSSAAIQRR